MHKVFGTKEHALYTDREGAYLIPIQNGKIGVIQTEKGYFLPGGGLNEGESKEACIRRECLEEIGYTVVIKYELCSAESYCEHPEIGHFHPVQTYVVGELSEKIQQPTETNHRLIWLDIHKAHGKLFPEMQNWAVEKLLETVNL